MLVFNTKTGQNESLRDNVAIRALTDPNSQYLPVEDAEYDVSNKFAGEQKVSGKDLYSKLNEGFALSDKTAERAEAYAKREGSALGSFTKSLLDESLTLGIAGEVKEGTTTNQAERDLLEAQKEVFGTSSAIGAVTGWVIPGLLSAGTHTGAKAGIKAIASLTPTGALVKGAHKLGIKGAKKFKSKLARFGAYVGISAGADAVALGSAKAVAEGIEDVQLEQDIDVQDVLKQGVKRASEVFTYSSIGMVAGAGVIKGAQTVGKGTGKALDFSKKAVDKISKTETGQKAREWLSKSFGKKLRKDFFNVEGKYSDNVAFKKEIVSSQDVLLKNSKDDDLLRFYEYLPNAVKDKYKLSTAKEIRKNFKAIMEDPETNIADGLSIVVPTLKKYNNGKIPTTQTEAVKAIDKAKINYGEELGKYRSVLDKAQKADVKNVLIKQQQLRAYKDDLIDTVTENMPQYKKDIKKYLSDSYLTQSKEGIKSSTRKLQLSKTEKDARVNSNKLLDWLMKNQAKKENVAELMTDLNKFNKSKLKDELYEVFKGAGFKDNEFAQVISLTSKYMNGNKSLFNSIVDVQRMTYILGKPKLNQVDFKYLNNFNSRYLQQYDKTLPTARKRVYDGVKGLVDKFYDKDLFVDNAQLQRILTAVKNEMGVFQKATTGASFSRSVNKINAIINSKQKLNIFDLNDIKTAFEDMAKFDTTAKPKASNLKARKVTALISNVEDDIFKRLESRPNFTNVYSGLINAKKNYRIVSNLMPRMDELQKGFYGLSPRDALLMGLGFYSGGLPIAGALLGVSKVIEHKAFYLKGANLFESLSDRLRGSKKIMGTLSEGKKLIGKLNSAQKLVPRIDFTIAGRVLGLGSVQDMETFADKLDEKSGDIDYLSTLGAEDSDAVYRNGGDQAEIIFKMKLMQNIALLKKLMPQGYFDKFTGKRRFTQEDIRDFKNTLELMLNPSSLISKAKAGTLTLQDVEKFKGFYEEHGREFIQSFIGEIQSKKGKFSRGVLQSYANITGMNAGFVIKSANSEEAQRKQELIKRQKSGGVQFTSKTNQPTQTQRILGQ